MPGVSDSRWAAEGTTPAAIEAALREMLKERHAENESFSPARALNMVCVVDKAWSGEVANRLRNVGRYHASRTIVLAVEPKLTRLDAVATIASDVHPKAGEFALLRETVIVDVGEKHLPALDTIVDPLVVTDLPTVLWSPHGHPEAVDVLLGLAQVVLLDSIDDPDINDGLERARELLEKAYVVDLAWLRSTPWRERVAAAFNPAPLRRGLGEISKVTVRHRADSLAAALLFCGWLCARLGWRPATFSEGGGKRREAHVRGRRGEIALRLDEVEQPGAPGLAGVTIEMASGRSVSLDRGPGGLKSVRRDREGKEQVWTVLGASRGEAGILGEGVRQALLRDPTYKPALSAARELL
jgi:glucose-6-phosphate dehydrogenase assembly protein OpcA